jgi:hypothetical protein
MMPAEMIMNGYMKSEDENMRNDAHLRAEDVAAYLDATVGNRDRERIETHAADCEECRREIAEVSQVLRRLRRTPTWRTWVPVAAAAAIIALLLVRPLWIETGPDSTPRFRGPESAGREGTVAIRVLEPRDESTLRSTAIAFVWHAGGAGASYQLTLTDDVGGVVWMLATTDTVALLPDTVSLLPASLYHWYVDGLLEDGRHASSGVHSFTTRR